MGLEILKAEGKFGLRLNSQWGSVEATFIPKDRQQHEQPQIAQNIGERNSKLMQFEEDCIRAFSADEIKNRYLCQEPTILWVEAPISSTFNKLLDAAEVARVLDSARRVKLQDELQTTIREAKKGDDPEIPIIFSFGDILINLSSDRLDTKSEASICPREKINAEIQAQVDSDFWKVAAAKFKNPKLIARTASASLDGEICLEKRLGPGTRVTAKKISRFLKKMGYLGDKEENRRLNRCGRGRHIIDEGLMLTFAKRKGVISFSLQRSL